MPFPSSGPGLPSLSLFIPQAQSDLLRQLVAAAGAELEDKIRTETGITW